jgi:uncharacterized UBP type Zn finger protein
VTTTTNIDLSAPCEHVDETKIRHVKRPGAGCEDCLAMKPHGWWVHLRECLTCGHVACCDSSPNQHATKHYHASKHPIVASVEVGETWTWCYVDDRFLSE